MAAPQTAQRSRAEAARLLAEAAAAIERGDDAAARALSERALAADPDNVTALTYLGALADRAGDLNEAERRFAAAAVAAPMLPSARNNHGAVLYKLGRAEQAARQFEVSLRLDRNQPSALFNLAQIRFAEGTPAGLRAARELFERAHALAPDAEIARALTVVSLRLEDRDAASRHYADYSARLPSSASGPAPAARLELGSALLEAGLAREAAAELNAAAAAEPSNPDALVRLARAHLALGDIPAAGRTLEGAVARGLESAAVYAELAEVYQRGGHIENAIPAMRLAVEREPRSETYRFRYGMLLTESPAPEAGRIRLEEAVKDFPNSPRLWFALGVARHKQGKNDDAASAFGRALELDPKFAPAVAYLGVTYETLGQYDKAAELYEQAVRLDDRMAVTLYLAASLPLKRNTADLARVEDYLRRAVRLDTSFAEARLALAKVLDRTGRAEEAVAELERVVKLSPELAEAHYHLGRLYTRLKRQPEAQTSLATFKRLSDAQKQQKESERREIVRRLAHVHF